MRNKDQRLMKRIWTEKHQRHKGRGLARRQTWPKGTNSLAEIDEMVTE